MSIPLYDRATEAARYISAKILTRAPRAAIVLGSGLGGVADAIEAAIEIPYDEIPFFMRSTVEGHAGKLIAGSLGGVDVIAMRGRFHFYEGYGMEEVTFPVRVFAVMGIKTLVLTNAAGGTAPHLGPGSLMVITDHINMMGDNPLRGENDARFGPRFPDMTSVYTPEYIQIAHEVAREMGITLAEGVYLGLRGPSYETAAEVRLFTKFGGDALGMSTVPEAIVARHCQINLLAISCITNAAAGMTKQAINHEEVMEVGGRAGRQLGELIMRAVPRLVTTDPTDLTNDE
ncbi:MAG TPA: purine-nucleoside phosphorylase [Blastocatellia bacterium]|nr:purine-nucleoside phosphorylase [Blastocatellia bacterium]